MTPDSNPSQLPQNPIEPEIKEEVVGQKKAFFSLNKKSLIILISCLFLLIAVSLTTYFLATESKKHPESIQDSQVQEPTSASPEEEITVFDVFPQEGSVINEELIAVSGKTLPNSVVAIYSSTDITSTESDNDGNFLTDLYLSPGINTLTITAYGKTSENTVEINVVYDDSVMGVKTDKSNSPAQEKSAAAIKNIKDEKASVGKIDSVNSSSLTIGTINSKKETIQIDKDTKIIGENNKQIQVSMLDPSQIVAVVKAQNKTGDSSASGSPSEKALKIYVKENNQVRKRNSVQGVVLSINENFLTLIHQVQNNRQYQIVIDENTRYKVKGVENATIADVKTGFRIIVIGDNNDDSSITAKMIHVIPAVAEGILIKQNILPTETPAESTVSATISPIPTISTPSASEI